MFGTARARGPIVGLVGLVVALAVALPVMAAGRSSAAKSAPSSGEYIVQLSSPPVASYRGGKQGLPATSPKRTGRKINSNSTAVRTYRAYLSGQQRAALARLGRSQPQVGYSYRTAFAGFSAHLTAKQVATLRKAPEVARVTKSVLKHITSAASDNLALDNATHPDSAAYLDLPEGLWQRLGGSENAGDGVVVGVIDTGIQPGHPSFADDPADGYTGPAYDPPPDTWGGTCQTGPGFTTADCNNKLIGARFYVSGFGATNLAPGSFLSPRDDEGHGSHTASTAAGNFGVDPEIDGNDMGVNRISGIAPRARVAAYKVCWTGKDADGCDTADSTAAIDQAVEDGVDVINYSVGSDTSTAIDPDSFAFLGASDAGVFVANSAGNAGPDSETVGTPASVPWLTAVAADSTSRSFGATATISDAPGADLVVDGATSGAGLSTPTSLVDGEDAPAGGATANDAAHCEDDALNPATVAGKVVLCLRGGTAGRVAKSKNVDEAGGAGMILYNADDAQETVADVYFVPGVHVSHQDGLEIKALIDDPTSDAKAAISDSTAISTAGAVLAQFSSRGPQTAVPDLAKPDVTAPGVNILAAAADEIADTPDVVPGHLFQLLSGTSMASPHVAGAGALLTQLHPTWSSAEIKSALMTSADADVKKEDGTTPADPFDAGSGEIDPTAAADPGLVVDAGTNDYFDYLETVDPVDFPPEGASTPAADLNLPSISNSALPGVGSTTRTFTSVDDVRRDWTVEVHSPPGITVTPSTDAFSIAAGAQKTIGLDFQVTTAPAGQYQFGELVLTSTDRQVRLPISLKPQAVKAPARVDVTTDKAAGSQPIEVQAGYAGQLSARGFGLAAAQVKAGETVAQGAGDPTGGTAAGSKLYEYDVANSQLFATRLSDVDGGKEGTDLDLWVYLDANKDGEFTFPDELVDFSASGTSDEHVELLDPDDGHYGVEVVGFKTEDPVSTFTLNTFDVSDKTPDAADGDGPTITVGGDPKSVTPGAKVPVSLDWSNVKSKGHYLGVVTYHNAATPTDGNRVAASLVEFEQTADAAAGGGTPTPPGGGGTPTPPGPPTQPKPKLKLTLTSAKLKGRTLTLKLRSNKRARIRTTVSRSGRKVASAKVRTVTTKTRTLRVKINRGLKAGRTYTVRIAARSGSRLLDSDSVRLKVRKKK
jgi:subtilisin family serine protease